MLLITCTMHYIFPIHIDSRNKLLSVVIYIEPEVNGANVVNLRAGSPNMPP